MKKIHVLLVSDVDGARVDGSWNHKPTEEELRYCIGGMWEAERENQVIKELIENSQVDIQDSACTSYELAET